MTEATDRYNQQAVNATKDSCSKLSRCKRLDYCDKNNSEILSDADYSFLEAIMKNTFHVLHPYLPETKNDTIT